MVYRWNTYFINVYSVRYIFFFAAGELLYDANEYLYGATGFLYEVGVEAWTEETRNRYRGTDIAFEIELNTGRCGVEWCKFEMAELEGGE